MLSRSGRFLLLFALPKLLKVSGFRSSYILLLYNEFTFGYDVWGKSTLAELISVVVGRTVVTPKLTLAGTAFRSSHKLVNDMNTMNVAGMYTYVNK